MHFRFRTRKKYEPESVPRSLQRIAMGAAEKVAQAHAENPRISFRAFQYEVYPTILTAVEKAYKDPTGFADKFEGRIG